MVSLKDELSALENPIPVFRDPEDDEDDFTRAKLTVKDVNNEHDDQQKGQIRSRQPVILSDFDKKYVGRKISRGKLQSYSDEDDDYSDDEHEVNDDGDGVVSSSESEHSQGSVKSEEESSEDATVERFKKKLKRKYTDPPELSDDEEESDNESGSDQKASEDENVEDHDDMEEMNEDQSPRKFSKSNIDDDVEKGTALRSQLGLWDSLLESRIKLQKISSSVNQIPNPQKWPSFIAEGGDDFSQATSSAQRSMKTLLDKLTELQTLLLVKYPETRQIANGENTADKGASIEDSDEDIPSDSDSETDTPATKVPKFSPKSPDDYPFFLDDRFQAFRKFRNTAIQKWYDKTRFASGKLNSKAFSSLEQSALKQIEQIMNDKSRLIKRTQLQRSVYRVLGSSDEKDENPDSAFEPIPDNQSDMKSYNPEIFDDDDFYHQLLRQLIERKTSGVDDPVALSRQWLEIQKIRNRVKKKVDRRASKGRKLRYDVHKKMINFMAQEDRSSWTDESRNDLFKSLFAR